ncbi:ROK family protein [Okibacterium endophyticum]
MTAEHAIGIDIGGTGIKGAVIDLATGELASERVKMSTPAGGKPQDILSTTAEVLAELTALSQGMPASVSPASVSPASERGHEPPEPAFPVSELPVGVCFPAIVRAGRTMSAANISDAWIGLEAEKLFESTLGRQISFVNDADAAGVAESMFGAAKDAAGLTILTTLGTGIGTALIYNGVLIPNAELGHLEINGKDIEHVAANSARERHGLSWEEWAARLQTFYDRLEAYFSPDLFVVGGGVSKQYNEFLPLLTLTTPIVPAVHRNNAGILGAASLASGAAEHLAPAVDDAR